LFSRPGANPSIPVCRGLREFPCAGFAWKHHGFRRSASRIARPPRARIRRKIDGGLLGASALPQPIHAQLFHRRGSHKTSISMKLPARRHRPPRHVASAPIRCRKVRSAVTATKWRMVQSGCYRLQAPSPTRISMPAPLAGAGASPGGSAARDPVLKAKPFKPAHAKTRRHRARLAAFSDGCRYCANLHDLQSRRRARIEPAGARCLCRSGTFRQLRKALARGRNKGIPRVFAFRNRPNREACRNPRGRSFICERQGLSVHPSTPVRAP